MRIALTRAVPPSLETCELTHLAREPIDVARAAAQHAAYEDVLRALGCRVERLPPTPDMPDSVFVEDAAVVVDECAVITRPGAASRRGETESVAAALTAYRPLRAIQPPGTLDGGDVLRLGRRLWVGIGSRSNAEGARQLGDALAPFGYSVATVATRGCLHLKTAASSLGGGLVLVNPEWVDGAALGAETVPVDPSEPFAANVLRIGDTVLAPASAARTRARMEQRGLRVQAIDASELAKAEAGLTCCSLILEG